MSLYPDEALCSLRTPLLSIACCPPVNASCSISFPEPKFKSMTKLNWFVNNEPVPPGYVRASRHRQLAVPNYPLVAFDTENAGDPFEASNEMSLSIKFLLNPEHFVDGSIKLRCTASSIPALYSRSAEAVAQLEPLRGTSFPGRYSSGLLYFRDSCSPRDDTVVHFVSSRHVLLRCHRLKSNQDWESFVAPRSRPCPDLSDRL